MSKSKTKKVKLKTTPHEELLKELEYLRAENAYLKKLQALVCLLYTSDIGGRDAIAAADIQYGFYDIRFHEGHS